MLEKYRATMTGEVLHSWAVDAQKEIESLTNKVAGLEEMYSELFEHHKETEGQLARQQEDIREVTSERNKYQKWYIETENKNASLRKEVERLNAHITQLDAIYENGINLARKQTTREIRDYILSFMDKKEVMV